MCQTLSMDELDPIAHVQPELLIEIGRLTVLGGKLESVLISVAKSLAIAEPEKFGFTRVAKEAKKQVNRGQLPEWSRADVEKLRDWLTETPLAMDKRNGLLHADSFQSMNADGEYVAVYMSHKTGVRMPQAVADYHAVALELRDLGRKGNRLDNDLLPRLRDDIPGAYDIRYPDPTLFLGKHTTQQR